MGSSESSVATSDVTEYNAALRHAERSAERQDFKTAFELFFDMASQKRVPNDALQRVVPLRRSADMLVSLERLADAAECYRSVLAEIHMALFPFPAEENWTPLRAPLLREYISSSVELSILLLTNNNNNDYKEAERTLTSAVEFVEHFEGCRSLALVTVLHALADLYLEVNKFPLAVLMLRRSIGIQCVALGPLHSSVRYTREMLASALEKDETFTTEVAAFRICGFFKTVAAVRVYAEKTGKRACYHKMTSDEVFEAERRSSNAVRIRTLEDLGLSDWDPRTKKEQRRSVAMLSPIPLDAPMPSDSDDEENEDHQPSTTNSMVPNVWTVQAMNEGDTTEGTWEKV